MDIGEILDKLEELNKVNRELYKGIDLDVLKILAQDGLKDGDKEPYLELVLRIKEIMGNRPIDESIFNIANNWVQNNTPPSNQSSQSEVL